MDTNTSPRDRGSKVKAELAKLREEFKKRIEILEREQTRRLMATFQEYYSRAFLIRTGSPAPDFLEK